tara:strand:- start:2925 stop:3377 length:453 start_codon:yes stop_codon:yes gene_type:complete
MGYKMGKVFNKKNLVNLLYVLTVALSVGYFVNKQYNALVCLGLVAGGIYLFNKNVMYALGISIVVTNLLLSMNYLNVREGLDKDETPDDPVSDLLKKVQNAAGGSDATADPVAVAGDGGQGLVQKARAAALRQQRTNDSGSTAGKRRVRR